MREKVAVFQFYAFDNFDFTRKIVENILDEKLVKMFKLLTTLISQENLSEIFLWKTRENVFALF